MTNSVLSICIPTFNRAPQLKACLDNIFNQLYSQNNLNRVEVVISDNDSVDITESVVKEYSGKYGNIRYFKNDINLGFDRNVDIVVSKAMGGFAWIIADDEYTKDGSIDLVLRVIKDNPDAAFIGICDEYQKVRGDYESFTNGSECLAKLGIFSGGVSRCIFSKKYLPVNRQRYYDNYWFHLSLAVEMAANRRVIMIKNLFIHQPAAIPRSEKGGAPFFTIISIRKIFRNSLCLGYDRDIIDKIVSGLTRATPRNIASAKLWGLHTGRKEFKLLFNNFYDNPPYLIILTIIFMCPTFILTVIKRVKDKMV